MAIVGGPNSGVSRKRRTLGRLYRRGAVKTLDQRSRDARAFFRRLGELQADQGGTSELSAVMRSAIERFVFIELRVLQLESMAMDPTTAKQFDPNAYLNYIAALVRLSDRLGYARRAKAIPSVKAYLEQRTQPADTQP
jgi:hypothetical protein